MKGFNDVAEMMNEIKSGQHQFIMTNAMMMIINYDGAIDNLKEFNAIFEDRFMKLFNLKITKARFRKMKPHVQDFINYLMKTVRNRCNVLFKINDDNKILMSHSTMDSYISLQRIFKYLQIGPSNSPSTRISYSSYPGCISSTDDFFIINGHMVVTETTLDFALSESE